MDVFKGFAAVWLARWIAGDTLPASWLPWAEALAGAASVIGHNWSIFLKFGGGAGTGPNVGWVAAIWWPMILITFFCISSNCSGSKKPTVEFFLRNDGERAIILSAPQVY